MGLTICWTDQLMSEANIELGDIHWLMDILQNIDVGLVVLDRNYDIQLWNGFMESHSGLSPQVARGENLFTLFPEIPKDWFCKKAAPVFELRTRKHTEKKNIQIRKPPKPNQPNTTTPEMTSKPTVKPKTK